MLLWRGIWVRISVITPNSGVVKFCFGDGVGRKMTH